MFEASWTASAHWSCVAGAVPSGQTLGAPPHVVSHMPGVDGGGGDGAGGGGDGWGGGGGGGSAGGGGAGGGDGGGGTGGGGDGGGGGVDGGGIAAAAPTAAATAGSARTPFARAGRVGGGERVLDGGRRRREDHRQCRGRVHLERHALLDWQHQVRRRPVAPRELRHVRIPSALRVAIVPLPDAVRTSRRGRRPGDRGVCTPRPGAAHHRLRSSIADP